MKKFYFSIFILLFVNGCASHQYDAIQMKDADDGLNYSLDSETLTIQYQEYQFVPDTKSLLIKCRKESKNLADKLSVDVTNFDYVTERNALLAITSCIAFGELE